MSAIPAPNVKLKRAYDPVAPDDGRRILVDRLWPRGVSKARAHLDSWMKDIAPSTELRTWFDHVPARWDEFRRRYRDELKTHAALLAELRRDARSGAITLVYGARDQTHNEAVVVRNVVLGRSETQGSMP
jgi:uncharacterized protein YeaO (DUF488 family)